MYKRIHNQFGTAGMILSVVAIVLALTGGAIAASSGKPGPKGPRGKTGKTGKTGPQGPQGLAGTNGKDGAAGTNGTNGANGKSVTVSGTAGGCTEGGTTVQVEGEPATAQEVCNGEEGPPGPEGALGTAGTTLPSGATETGIWGTGESEPAGKHFYSASLAIPLKERVEFGQTVLVKSNETSAAGCPGRGDNGVPEAEPGFFCVYVGPEVGGTVEHVISYVLNEGAEPPVWEWINVAGATGAIIWTECTTACFIGGTWAVTAE